MNFITAQSSSLSLEGAVDDIKKQFGDFEPTLVLFFSSIYYNENSISEKMQAAFSPAMTFGCTTAGEIISGKMSRNSVVAMGFSAEAIPEYQIAVMKKIREGNSVAKAFSVFEERFGITMREMDPTKYVGIILADGLSGAEEGIMEKIGDLTDVLFIGASAGDDLHFNKTHVFAGGKAYTDSALLLLIKPDVEFDFIKTQSFKSTGITLQATKVDEENREVIEFNGIPALDAYADALGQDKAHAAKYFQNHPIGLMDGDEPYVRSPQRIIDDRIRFYCNVKEGVDLSLLESGNIIDDTLHALETKRGELGSISAIINFNCILRTLELRDKGLEGAYGELFSNIPTVGFSTYGEEFIGHINQTATMLVFK